MCQLNLGVFDADGKNCSAFVGVLGGKDSPVVASLRAKALGK